jgi:archaetidylinositol phosphate synthase
VSNDTWTHAAARVVVRPLIGTGVTPNHLTTLRLLSGLAACACLASVPYVHGHPHLLFWGGLLWVVSAFLDRADGELARIGDMMSPGGHRYDYLVDNGINCLFFLSIGIGLTDAHLFGHRLGEWAIGLGVLTSIAMFGCNWMAERYENQVGGGERIIAGAWGFHVDDALYLLGPAAWFGLLVPILIGAAIGTSIMAVVILAKLLRLPAAPLRV